MGVSDKIANDAYWGPPEDWQVALPDDRVFSKALMRASGTQAVHALAKDVRQLAERAEVYRLPDGLDVPYVAPHTRAVLRLVFDQRIDPKKYRKIPVLPKDEFDDEAWGIIHEQLTPLPAATRIGDVLVRRSVYFVRGSDVLPTEWPHSGLTAANMRSLLGLPIYRRNDVRPVFFGPLVVGRTECIKSPQGDILELSKLVHVMRLLPDRTLPLSTDPKFSLALASADS